MRLEKTESGFEIKARETEAARILKAALEAIAITHPGKRVRFISGFYHKSVDTGEITEDFAAHGGYIAARRQSCANWHHPHIGSDDYTLHINGTREHVAEVQRIMQRKLRSFAPVFS